MLDSISKGSLLYVSAPVRRGERKVNLKVRRKRAFSDSMRDSEEQKLLAGQQCCKVEFYLTVM